MEETLRFGCTQAPIDPDRVHIPRVSCALDLRGHSRGVGVMGMFRMHVASPWGLHSAVPCMHLPIQPSVSRDLIEVNPIGGLLNGHVAQAGFSVGLLVTLWTYECDYRTARAEKGAYCLWHFQWENSDSLLGLQLLRNTKNLKTRAIIWQFGPYALDNHISGCVDGICSNATEGQRGFACIFGRHDVNAHAACKSHTLDPSYRGQWRQARACPGPM